MTLLPKLKLYNNIDHDSITQASNYTITLIMTLLASNYTITLIMTLLPKTIQ